MSNDLLLVALAVGVMIALLLARFAIVDAPGSAILQRIGRVVHEADPDLRARVSLQELQRPMRRGKESEVDR